ncbi:MAG: hypothetical protein KIT09_16675 [Bryobacteraceae bacterium]|nr:hypothetical protein [Bryobacteraceae bacterium]
MKHRLTSARGSVSIAAVVLVLTLVTSGGLTAQETPRDETSDQQDISELSRQVEILAEEVERLRSSEPEIVVTDDQARQLGLGSSAASVYRRSEGVSIAGYGEMLFEAYDGENQSGAPVGTGNRLDFLRAIIYFGYRFNDKFLFNSEIELEHSNEISVEFAYIDWIARPELAVRGGMLLVPMGLTNEFHEPTAFLSARRSRTETNLIPTTWRENGAGIVGSAGILSYRAYVVNGLRATGFTADGLRGGRQKGARALATDMAFVGRADVAPMPGVFVGASLYVGDSSQGEITNAAGNEFSVKTTIGEAHAQAQIRGIDFRALYARSSLTNAAELSLAKGLTGADGVGEAQQGGYVQIGYNIFSQVREGIELTPFYRFEKLDTQARVAPGFIKDPARDRTYHVFGVSFKPIPNVAIKADYEVTRNAANTGVNQFGLALGYSF